MRITTLTQAAISQNNGFSLFNIVNDLVRNFILNDSYYTIIKYDVDEFEHSHLFEIKRLRCKTI